MSSFPDHYSYFDSIYPHPKRVWIHFNQYLLVYKIRSFRNSQKLLRQQGQRFQLAQQLCYVQQL